MIERLVDWVRGIYYMKMNVGDFEYFIFFV